LEFLVQPNFVQPNFVQLSFGSTQLWFNSTLVQLNFGSTQRWFNSTLVQPTSFQPSVVSGFTSLTALTKRPVPSGSLVLRRVNYCRLALIETAWS
jgi:hypothetical protein